MAKKDKECKNARPQLNKRRNSDIVIAGNVGWRDDLSWDVKVFYGIVRVLSKNDYYCCYASNEYLLDVIKKDNDSTLRRYMKQLEDIDVIKRDSIYIADEYGNYHYMRAIVPTELFTKFSKKKDEMLDLKGSLKNTSMTVQKCTPTPCKNAHHIINMYPYKENNKSFTNNEDIYNPQTPLQGGDQSATLVEPEQFEVLGKFGNVRLTQSQRTAFRGEFGAELASALIEQLSAYIQSGVRRIRKKADHYAILRDWALRRTQPTKQIAPLENFDADITGGTIL